MSDKENVLILDRISDFNSVISFYEETAELITKLRPNITMTELKDEFESLSQYEKIVFAARAMVVSESLKLFNIEEILSKYRIGNVELERMFEGIDFLDKFHADMIQFSTQYKGIQNTLLKERLNGSIV